MKDTKLDTMREMLHISPVAQMLFDGERLAALSPAASGLFPEAKEGADLHTVFGEAAEQFRRFQRRGSLLFPAESARGTCDVTLTDWNGMTLAAISPDEAARGDQRMLAVAERMRQFLGAGFSVTSKLLPQFERSEDPRDLERASELNKSLYSLLRLSGSLERRGCDLEQLLQTTTQTDLTMWLEELAEQWAPLCEAAGRTLSCELPYDRSVCSVNRELLREALEHVLSNAIKFSEPGGEITLSLRETERNLVITLRDRGCGIPAGQLGRVFSGESRDLVPDPRQGAGLGLPVAKRIVQAHGGMLMLESVEGKGTAVHVSLPVVPGSKLELRTPVLIPVSSEGIDPMLVGLSDVLPAEVFDPRSTDL